MQFSLHLYFLYFLNREINLRKDENKNIKLTKNVNLIFFFNIYINYKADYIYKKNFYICKLFLLLLLLLSKNVNNIKIIILVTVI